MADRYKKPHIALFINSMRKGGAERVMANLAEYLYSEGWKVTVVTTWFAPPEYELPHAGWDYTTGRMKDTSGLLMDRIYSEPEASLLQGSRRQNFQVRFRTIQDIWVKIKPDIILSFIGMTNIMAVLTARKLGIPVVVSVRSTRSLEYNTFKLRFLADHTYPHASGIVFQTAATQAAFPAKIRRKSVVLPNSVNPDFIRPRYTGHRAPIIVSVGRLDENKNQGMLIRAFAAIKIDFPASQLQLYGDGPSREQLVSLAGSLGLRTQQTSTGAVEDLEPTVHPDVIFEGTTDAIAERICKAAVYVLCSNIEGMPNSLIEAMSLGLACISTDCEGGGPASLIESGLNGYLIMPGDERALESKLRYLLSNDEEVDRIGRNAAKVQEDYNPEKINAAWESYLLSKLSS